MRAEAAVEPRVVGSEVVGEPGLQHGAQALRRAVRRVAAAVHAVPHLGDKVAGAFLVAPPDVANPEIRPKHLMTFGPYPRDPLPFPSLVVASRNDPFGTYEHADDMAAAWGALMLDAGEAGHINAESGHGPWPEGTMVFAQFLGKLKPPA